MGANAPWRGIRGAAASFVAASLVISFITSTSGACSHSKSACPSDCWWTGCHTSAEHAEQAHGGSDKFSCGRCTYSGLIWDWNYCGKAWQEKYCCCKRPTPAPTPFPTPKPTPRPFSTSGDFCGKWVLVHYGPPGGTASYVRGVELTTGHEYTTEVEKIVSEAVSKGGTFSLHFGHVGGEYETSTTLTSSVSEGIASTTASYITEYTEYGCEQTCSPASDKTTLAIAIYQYVVGSRDDDVKVHTCHFWCVEDDASTGAEEIKKPNCPTTRCGNKDCSRCKNGTFEDEEIDDFMSRIEIIVEDPVEDQDTDDPPDASDTDKITDDPTTPGSKDAASCPDCEIWIPVGISGGLIAGILFLLYRRSVRVVDDPHKSTVSTKVAPPPPN